MSEAAENLPEQIKVTRPLSFIEMRSMIHDAIARNLSPKIWDLIVQRIASEAICGNVAAAKLCFEYTLGKPRVAEAVKKRFNLGEIKSAADIAATQSNVLAAMANAEISAEEAKSLMEMLELNRKSYETAEIETRLAALEREKQEQAIGY